MRCTVSKTLKKLCILVVVEITVESQLLTKILTSRYAVKYQDFLK